MTILWAVIGGVCLVAATAATRWGWKAVRHQFVADLGDALEKRWTRTLQPLYDELKFNGGQSLKDRVWMIDSKLDQHFRDHRQAENDRARGTSRWDPPEGTAV